MVNKVVCVQCFGIRKNTAIVSALFTAETISSCLATPENFGLSGPAAKIELSWPYSFYATQAGLFGPSRFYAVSYKT